MAPLLCLVSVSSVRGVLLTTVIEPLYLYKIVMTGLMAWLPEVMPVLSVSWVHVCCWLCISTDGHALWVVGLRANVVPERD